MIKYLVDTNIVSEFLREKNPAVTNMDSAMYDENCAVFICSIVYYEIERGAIAGGKFKQLRDFYSLYAKLPHLFLDRDNLDTIKKASEIYGQLRKKQTIGDDDIFIAAIAIVNDCILVTDNVKHFERIEGLKVINWKENFL